MQVRGLREIRGPEESPAAAERPGIALDVDDLYVAGESVTLRARLINVDRSPGMVRARVEPVYAPGAAAPPVLDLVEAADGLSLVLPDLPPGLYRVEVRAAKAGAGAPPPVHDLFEIADVADGSTQ
jgi:hypothetical protein